MVEAADGWLICKRGLYYGPNRYGYTGIRALAGIYSEAEARDHDRPDDGLSIVRFADAPEFAPCCDHEAARNWLIKERDAAKFVPGVWRCPKCEFRLIQSSLNMTDGTVTARDEAGDKCPNCAGPLWRCSWADEARDAYKTAESQMDRAIAAETRVADLTNGRDDGLETAISVVEKLSEEHCRECGVYDPSTNATEFSGAAEDVDIVYQNILDALHALRAARSPSPPAAPEVSRG